jgi:hypothetical protein
MYYCYGLSAENQIFRQRKASLPLRQPGSVTKSRAGDTPGQGSAIGFKLKPEGSE